LIGRSNPPGEKGFPSKDPKFGGRAVSVEFTFYDRFSLIASDLRFAELNSIYEVSLLGLLMQVGNGVLSHHW